MSDPRRPSKLQRSRGIHPEGSVSTPSGETHSSNAGTRTIGRGASPSHPASQRAISERATLGDGERISASVSFSTRRNVRGWLRSIHGRVRREVEGDVRSSGVPVDVVECKKHRESSLENPAKDLQLPSAPSGGDLRVDDTTSWVLDSGRREGEVIFAWKRGSQSLSRA